MTVRLAPRGHATFDVYDGPTFVGSVWHYHEGWTAMDRHRMQLVSGFHDTAEAAAAVLAADPDIEVEE